MLEMHAQLLQNGVGVGEHVHQMGDRRALITRHVRHAGLQKGLGNCEDSLAAEFLAFTEIKLLNFFLEEPFRHLCHLPRPLYGGVEAAQRTPPQ